MITEKEHQIIGMIYDAALNAQWENVLEALVEYMESSAGAFIAFDQIEPHVNFTHIYNFNEEFLENYQDAELRILDMRLHQAKYRQAGIGHVLTLDGTDYAKDKGSDEYIFYEKCIKTSGMTYVAGILLEDGKYNWTLFAVYRRPEQPFFTAAECLKLEYFSTHIRRALQMYRQFNLLNRKNNNFRGVLDALKVGVILVDRYYNLMYINIPAQKILATSSLLWVDQYNRLKTKKCFQFQLNKYISSVFRYVNPSQEIYEDVGGAMVLYEHIEKPELKLSIAPFSRFANINSDFNCHEKAIILITHTHQQYQVSAAYLYQAYDLTKREIAICELFLNGRNLEEIAEELKLTLSSLRTYFKYIYGKTGCTSQIELMHLLMGITLNFEHII